MYSRQMARKDEQVLAQEDRDTSYPSARYFQIHFEHLYALIAELKTQLDQSNEQLAALRAEIKASSLPKEQTTDRKNGANRAATTRPSGKRFSANAI